MAETLTFVYTVLPGFATGYGLVEELSDLKGRKFSTLELACFAMDKPIVRTSKGEYRRRGDSVAEVVDVPAIGSSAGGEMPAIRLSYFKVDE